MTREEINRRIVDLKLSLANEPMMGSVQKKAILDNFIKLYESQIKDPT